MSKEILINVTPQETRVAILENGVLQELYIERSRNRGLVGNIYKGKVCRVLPGMEAAFIEVGMERAAFLHVSDIISMGSAKESANDHNERPSIASLLHEGDDILVQVIKDPMGTKGARLTSHITIPSRYLVFMPKSNNIGVSTRIEDETERDRLREMLMLHEQLMGDSGYIIRTAAESASPESLGHDVTYLNKLWQSISETYRQTKAGNVVHEDLPLFMRVLRDMMDDDLEKIRVDSRETWRRMSDFAARFIPGTETIIEHYPGERPIFDLYAVEDEIQKSLERKVHLKSGGYLIIDQTEAMTTIDINTGAFVGHRNLEETI
ncbi:MAG: Rne/Rng family ribonuclease, partial [Gammaproteobacteria bacterium]|nr:Rne/Rng family ribonuclease [Gammaproteobacteria bacterium]